MSSVFLLFLFTSRLIAADKINRNVDTFGSLRIYPETLYFSILPYYEVDIPEQEAKLFGANGVTKYETITVKETVRPVCLNVHGDVPSCDEAHHHHDYPSRPKNRRPTITDYESYFIEPTKPNMKIEITEIPFRGAFLLADATVLTSPAHEHDDGDKHDVAAHRETPQLRVVPAAVPMTAGPAHGKGPAEHRVFLPGLQWPAPFGLNLGSVLAGSAVAQTVGSGHSGRPQYTIAVTRVERVVDNAVTVTLVPKNCMPSGWAGWTDALKPCGKSYRSDEPSARYAHDRRTAVGPLLMHHRLRYSGTRSPAKR